MLGALLNLLIIKNMVSGGCAPKHKLVLWALSPTMKGRGNCECVVMAMRMRCSVNYSTRSTLPTKLSMKLSRMKGVRLS